jgi:superfamily II DNA or RNA helicase
MDVMIDGWAWLDRAALTEAHLRALRDRLTVYPRVTTDIAAAKAPEAILLYRDRPADGRFGVPRAFYAAAARQANQVDLLVSYGQPLPGLATRYRAEGPFVAQEEALLVLQHRIAEGPWGGGILCAPCGSGKSIAAVEFARRVGRTTLILVHKEFFLDQWEQRILEVVPDARIGRVQQRTCDWEGCDFVIALIQSLAADLERPRYPVELFDAFGTMVYDEIHRVGSASWSQVVPRFSAAYRLGLSATVRRLDGSEAVFQDHVGPIVHTMRVQAMLPAVRRLESRTVLVPPIGEDGKRRSVHTLNSAEVQTALAVDADRTRAIAEEVARALRRSRKVMVISHRLEHLRAIELDVRRVLNGLPAPVPVEIGAYTGSWFTGPDGALVPRTREELRRAEQANLVLATVQLAAEGLDIPPLDVLVLATPMSDPEQAVGRVRRWCLPEPKKCAYYCPWRAGVCTGKPGPVVVDVRDPQVALAQSRARRRDAYYRRMAQCEIARSDDSG